MNSTNVIERAFELAGECTSIEKLTRRLEKEGYMSVRQHLGGQAIRAQLRKRMVDNQAPGQSAQNI